MFKISAGVDLVHMPFRGDAPMITALIAGDIQLAFLPQPTGFASVQGTRSGRWRHRPQADDALPDVPTVQEQGVAGSEEGSWNGMFVPAGTPPDIVLRIQQDVAKVLADRVRESAFSVGQEPVGNTPAASSRPVQGRHRALRQMIEQAKIPKLD